MTPQDIGEQRVAAHNEKDLGLGNPIASFTIITQYADHELLRQQEREEAARLGLQS